jgi:hypothetical protein
MMFEQFRQALEEYKKWRHPGLTPLQEGAPYALFAEHASSDVKLHWNEQWPNSDDPGVYLIFSASGLLLYVGKSWFLGSRLGAHFGGSSTCWIKEGGWTEDPLYVITVGVPAKARFEAACLEEFLIERLQPCDNSVGKLRGGLISVVERVEG